MKQIPTIQSIEQFLFEIPLYAQYKAPDDENLKWLSDLYGKTRGIVRIDGYCPYCHRESTFTVRGVGIPSGDPWSNIKTRFAYDEMYITCVRSDSHNIHYYFRMKNMVVEKIGQYPSLASVAQDAVSPFRKHMNEQDGHEFHKAIGLAAHGVGVGSFVYLRRVFERLVYKRFEEFKAEEGWQDSEFYPVRMEDKIELLQRHLPAFLVENRKVYSILSIGIHELDEETCLTFFEVLKQAIIIILEDDEKTRHELQRRETFAKAIASFAPPQKD